MPQDIFSDERLLEIFKSSLCSLTSCSGTRQSSGRYGHRIKEERDNPIFIDLFYAALHLMEAFLAVKGIHVEDQRAS